MQSNKYPCSGSCHYLYPEEGLDFIIHWSVSLLAPAALVMVSSLLALPSALRRHADRAKSHKQDTVILRRVANNKATIYRFQLLVKS